MTVKFSSHEIDDLAAEWAAKIDAGPLDAETQASLDAWLEVDIRHLGAFAKARAVAVRTERARALGPNFDPASFVETLPHVQNRRRFMLMGGVAAAAAAVAVTAGAGLMLMTEDGFSTKIGETRVVPLEDGSIVTLNTASKIVVSYTDDLRLIRLVRGEALFDVAKNPNRPFIVEANDARVRAVGTSFTVALLQEKPVQVLVREGVVEVTRPDEPAAAPVRMEAATSAVVPRRAPVVVKKIAITDVNRELAWRMGRVAFEGETLKEAAATFARYSETRIVINDPAIANATVAGLYVSNDPVGFSKAIALAMNLHVEVRDGEVRLTQ